MASAVRAERGPRSPLRPAVLIAVLVGIAAGVGGLVYAKTVERRLGTEAYRAGLRVTRIVAEIHGRGLTDVRTLLTELAGRPEIRNQDPVLCGITFADVLRRSPLLSNLIAVTPAGLVFCSGAPPGAPGDGVDAALLGRAVGTREFVAGTFTADSVSGRITLPLLRPVMDDGGTVRSILVAAVDPGALARVAVHTGVPPGAMFAVVDQSGTVLAHHPQPERWLGQQIADPGLITRASTQGENLIDSAGLDGLARFVALTPLPGGGGRFAGAWAVVGVAREDGRARLLEVGGVSMIVVSVGGGIVSTVTTGRSARRARERRARHGRKTAWDPFTVPPPTFQTAPAPAARAARTEVAPPPAATEPAATTSAVETPAPPLARVADQTSEEPAEPPVVPAPDALPVADIPVPDTLPVADTRPTPDALLAPDLPATPPAIESPLRPPRLRPTSRVPSETPPPPPPARDIEQTERAPLVTDDYSAYWGLAQPPFDNSPNPRFLYRSPEHEEALVRLTYAVQRRRGVAMLTGADGCGKTTVSRALIQDLEPDRYEIALLGKPTWNVVTFLREILYQLGVETAEEKKPALLHLLNDVLLRNFQGGRDTLVIVDEAQFIDDPAVFEELRLLLNFQTDDRFLMTLILIGSSELLPKVRRLRHLDQRIAVRFHLNTLDAQHTAAYIAHRLATAGRAEPVFTDAAIQLIFEFTKGAPRMINNVCDVALLVGALHRLERIDVATVTTAIQDTFGGSRGGGLR